MEECLPERAEEIPMKRSADAEEVAQAILFLATPRSSYVTGQWLAVDDDGGSVRCF